MNNNNNIRAYITKDGRSLVIFDHHDGFLRCWKYQEFHSQGFCKETDNWEWDCYIYWMSSMSRLHEYPDDLDTDGATETDVPELLWVTNSGPFAKHRIYFPVQTKCALAGGWDEAPGGYRRLVL